MASAAIPRMTWGPTVISCEKKPNRTRRHDGWELSELTDHRIRIDRPLKNTARGELEAPVAIDPKRLQFRFTHRLRHDRAPVSSQFIDSYIRIGAQGGGNRDPSGASRLNAIHADLDLGNEEIDNLLLWGPAIGLELRS